MQICLFKGFFIFLILLPIRILTQVYDDFSDGDFTSNPEWFGDVSLFQISNSSAIPPQMKPALQLNGTDSDTTILYLPNNLIQNTEWQCWVKMSFNTSANNNARVYLVADQAELDGPQNAYYVKLGGVNDSISLVRQNGLEHQEIINGIHAFTGNSTNILRIKVTRDEDGLWNLYSDMDGGFNFIHEGSVTDFDFTATNYFGIFCKYTSSNATKFYFDDFYVNEIIIDTIPPKISSVDVIFSNQVDVQFDEIIEVVSAEDVSNYIVDNGIGSPISAALDEADQTIVHLSFEIEFEPSLTYEISISNIEDLSGNTMETDIATFIYILPVEIFPYDIVINELMADENPTPNNLPEADYIELYNRTSEPLNLKNCTLQPRESSDPVIFPEIIIQPDSFLIVTANGDVELFEAFGQVVGLPSFSLNNEGSISLRNSDGKLIHHISYTKDWYHDEVKQEGGWSIEQIDPQHPCHGEANWKASIDDRGGSPGMRNSVDGINISLPEISSIVLLDESTISISFNHSMDSLSLINKEAYSVDQEIGQPENISIENPEFNLVSLQFSQAFETNMVYNLSIVDTIFNCSGEIIDFTVLYPIVVPVSAGSNDIVINEIFADPTPPVGLPEYEYVEIFNTTNSYLNIKGWTLAIGTVEKEIPDIVIHPLQYIILTHEDAVNFYGMYGRSVGFSSLSLTNGGTTLNLINDEGELISSVSYSDDWYHDDDKAEGGWSLEQIDPFSPCSGYQNWTACTAEMGGSPGHVNSVDAVNNIEPLAERMIYLDENSFELQFNQEMDLESMLDKLNYSVDHGIGNPTVVSLSGISHNIIELTFSESLNKQTIYTLSINEEIRNCIGTSIGTNSHIEFGVAEIAVKEDLAINEVLFNPLGDGVDFVEVYNKSEKLIDLSLLKLGSVKINDYEPNDSIYKVVADKGLILFPEQYLVLTVNPKVVYDQYYIPDAKSFLKMNSFPSYNNDLGMVLLKSSYGTIIDFMNYDEDMHHPLLNTVEGVSLERINFSRLSSDPTNWHSAASSVGFATPGYKNSQFSELGEIEDPITIDPEIFSPNNDGFNDVVNIIYNFGEPGYTANVTIYDSHGRLVRLLINNELLGVEGAFSWDGLTDDNRKAGIGMYIAYFEAFNMNGVVKKYKKSIVLAGKL